VIGQIPAVADLVCDQVADLKRARIWPITH